jgi:hypothetical protein
MKSKKTIIVILIILGTVLFLTLLLTNRLSVTEKQISTIPILPSDTTQNLGVTQPIKNDISGLSKKVSDQVSQQEKDKITPLLPISVKNFQTSVGITTNINIFSIKSDPSQVVRVEIYGINYYLSDTSSDNPQAVAFSESFTETKNLLMEKGIDINNLQIIYGNRNYIQQTAENWIKTFNLLP